MADVSINVGTDNSSLEGSKVTIGDVAGGEQNRLSEHIRERIKTLEDDVRSIKRYLRGGDYGEPGLTHKTDDALRKIDDSLRKIADLQHELKLLYALEEKADRQEMTLERVNQTMNRYAPMWESMYVNFSSRMIISSSVVWAFVVLLFLAVAVVYFVTWYGRAGGG